MTKIGFSRQFLDLTNTKLKFALSLELERYTPWKYVFWTFAKKNFKLPIPNSSNVSNNQLSTHLSWKLRIQRYACSRSPRHFSAQPTLIISTVRMNKNFQQSVRTKTKIYHVYTYTMYDVQLAIYDRTSRLVSVNYNISEIYTYLTYR